MLEGERPRRRAMASQHRDSAGAVSAARSAGQWARGGAVLRGTCGGSWQDTPPPATAGPFQGPDPVRAPRHRLLPGRKYCRPTSEVLAGGEGLVVAGSGAEDPGQITVFGHASPWLLPGSSRSCPTLPPGVSLALRCWPPGAASALHLSPSSRASYPGRAMAVRVRSMLVFLKWLGV